MNQNDLIIQSVELQDAIIEQCEAQLEMSRNTLVGCNTVMYNPVSRMFLSLTVEDGMVVGCYPLSNPVKATHLSPVDGRNLSGNFVDGNGDAYEPMTYVTAYRTAISNCEEIITALLN